MAPIAPEAVPTPCLACGDSYDNALAETIHGLHKAEVIHRRGPWRSFEAVEFAMLEWVDWFNNRRLLAQMRSAGRVRKRLMLSVDRTFDRHHEADPNDPLRT